MAALVLPLTVQALHRVDPGEVPVLQPDEGLLAVSVDTDTALGSVKFLKSGAIFKGDVLAHVKAGRTMHLYVVPAGRYQWNKVDLIDAGSWASILTLKNDPEYAFEVKAGQITYAGELVVRPQGWWRARIWIANRSLPVIDWLREKFPATYAQYPFTFNGHYPDPFPEFYRKELATVSRSPAELDAKRDPPAVDHLPLPPKLLWEPGRIVTTALSPDGLFVAEIVRERDGVYGLDLIDIDARISQRVVKSAQAIDNVQWKDERTFLAELPSAGGTQLHVLRVGERFGDARRIEHFAGPVGGDIVDLLPESPDEILYAIRPWESRTRRSTLEVFRLNVASQKGVDAFSKVDWSRRLNGGVVDDTSWFADGHGRLRLAWTRKDGMGVLVYGGEGKYREVMRSPDDEGLELLRLSYEGNVVYALSDEGRAQRDLVVYDLEQGKITKTLYSKPGVDVVSAIFDARRQPIGVRYHQGGILVSEYFEERDRKVEAMLRAAFPQRSVTMIERNLDESRMLLWVDGSDQPLRLYYLDVARHEARLIDELYPQLQKQAFVPTHLLKVQGSDGTSIDAFVTLPPGQGKRPLVVMPHGGPIGVADAMHFDKEVQFLASLGYAVLQVNFRGSDGYGRAFREAGRHQYGHGIEDDIDTALEAALQRFPLDKERMCALGTSYGGYSALLSAIRGPGRFRCGVSISGVSDRILFFTTSDGATTKRGREELERQIGNPNTELDRLVETSPLYQYRKLTLPVMLVHGGEDQRVDYEHTRRLIRMLNLAGRPPVVMLFQREGHGFGNVTNTEAMWNGIAGFLKQHLVNAGASSERAQQ